MIVPFLSCELDNSILWDCVNSLLFSAYFSWFHQYLGNKPRCFWKSMKTLQNFLSSCLELLSHIERNQIFHHCVCLAVAFGKSMLTWGENVDLTKDSISSLPALRCFISALSFHWNSHILMIENFHSLK